MEKKEERPINKDLDIYKKFLEVESGINEDIKSDFVQAKLNDNDKQYITDMTALAYRAKKIIQKNKEHRIWDKGKKRELTKDEENWITKKAEIVFNTFMIKTLMTVILNRNVTNNYILELITKGTKRDEELETNQEEERTIGERLKKYALKNEETK